MMDQLKSIIEKSKTFLWLAAILIVWELSARLGIVNEYILPPFSKVVINLFSEMTKGVLGFQILNSLYVVLEGFVISLALGLIIGTLCISSRIVESFFQALAIVMNPLPGIAILPLVMMWFGVGNGAMLFLIIHGVLWPLITNFIVGFQSIPKIYLDWGRNIGLTPVQMMRQIHFFAIMPYIISALRVGWGRAWRALISAEMVFGMIGSLGGIGYYIYQNRAYANMTNVLVGVFVIIIIGVVVDQGIFRTLEKHTIEKWGKG